MISRSLMSYYKIMKKLKIPFDFQKKLRKFKSNSLTFPDPDSFFKKIQKILYFLFLYLFQVVYHKHILNNL